MSRGGELRALPGLEADLSLGRLQLDGKLGPGPDRREELCHRNAWSTAQRLCVPRVAQCDFDDLGDQPDARQYRTAGVRFVLKKIV